MKTQNTTDESELPIRVKIRRWSGEKAGITKGWLLLSVLLGWVFLGCAIFAAVRTVQLDNRVTEERLAANLASQVESCMNGNVTRAEARLVAVADVEEDRRIWLAIDEVLDDGLPPQLGALVFESLVDRESQIEETYVLRDCSTIIQETP